jgi:hypothetical protein
MAQDLVAGVDQSLAILRGGAAEADVGRTADLLADLEGFLARSEHGELAGTLGRLRAALADGEAAGAIGGLMSTLGGQLEAVATRVGGSGAELRELAELLKGEGSRIAG